MTVCSVTDFPFVILNKLQTDRRINKNLKSKIAQTAWGPPRLSPAPLRSLRLCVITYCQCHVRRAQRINAELVDEIAPA